ncbi:MAG: DNA polymerase IV [Erysipelotrichales bacterium]|nr:DNA polymerase IV [Erysipelotrichales bacterium]
MARVIFHIDLNAFFATAEVLRNPELANKPLAVGGHGRKGVVSTASYEARKYGVHSAMPLFEAKELCPELIVVSGDHAWYEKLSERFIRLITEYTSTIEQASIDECYADMTEAIKQYKHPLDLAYDIQKSLKEKIGLTCSIGIGPNKFLAKIGSDYKKPNGITIIRKREIQTKLWPLPIEAMGGIGNKTAPLLKARNIKTIGDFAKIENHEIIRQIIGKNASVYIGYANGEDQSPISNYREMKSISQSTTLDDTITDFVQVKTTFNGLVKQIASRLAAEQVSGNNVGITIRYYDFHTITRSVTLDKYVSSYEEIMTNCVSLFELNDKEKPIRLLGVSVNNLKSNSEIDDIDLFNYFKNINDTDELISSLNNEMTNNYLFRMSDLIQNK